MCAQMNTVLYVFAAFATLARKYWNFGDSFPVFAKTCVQFLCASSRAQGVFCFGFPPFCQPHTTPRPPVQARNTHKKRRAALTVKILLHIALWKHTMQLCNTRHCLQNQALFALFDDFRIDHYVFEPCSMDQVLCLVPHWTEMLSSSAHSWSYRVTTKRYVACLTHSRAIHHDLEMYWEIGYSSSWCYLTKNTNLPKHA